MTDQEENNSDTPALETAQFSVDNEDIPEDLLREKIKWEIEEAKRRLKIDQDKADKALQEPMSSLVGLPQELLKAKILSDISLADRKMRLEELKAENDMVLADRIESFRQAQALEMTALLKNQNYDGWIRKYWRSAAGWTYLFICVFDFVLAPVIFAILPLWTKQHYQPWASLTLSNGGLMHVSFGAILGVAAWTRGQGDLARAKLASDKPSTDTNNTP